MNEGRKEQMEIQSLLQRNLNSKEKSWACGPEGDPSDPGIRSTPSFYGKGNAGSEVGGAAMQCLWQTLGVEGGEITQGE